MDNLIKCEKICQYFDSKHTRLNVLDNFSLEIGSGEKVAIIGDSGCGKTSLLNIIGLLVKQKSGDLFINNRNVDELKNSELERLRNEFLGYVFQDYLLLNDDTIKENLEVPLIYNKKKLNAKNKIELIRNSLDSVNIDIDINKKVTDLSGGEKQRIAIARALINNPSVVLADEPTGALDEKNSEDVFNVLIGSINSQRGLVLVTHNYELAKKCDRIIKLEKSKCFGL